MDRALASRSLGSVRTMRAAVREIAHRAGHAALHPVEITPAVIGQRLGWRDSGELEAAFLGQALDFGSGHVSIIGAWENPCTSAG